MRILYSSKEPLLVLLTTVGLVMSIGNCITTPQTTITKTSFSWENYGNRNWTKGSEAKGGCECGSFGINMIDTNVATPFPSKTNKYIYNFQRWMSRFPQRWRTQRNAIRNANCKTSWIIKTLNAHCAFGIFPVACLSECLWIPLSVGLF
jgi:hypothetical protein